MPIVQTTAYRVGERVFPTIEEAQAKELMDLMCGDKTPTDNEQNAAEFIVEHTDEIVAILTCTPVKKPKKTRSDKGTKRTPKIIMLPDA